jgi:hypothetical protein
MRFRTDCTTLYHPDRQKVVHKKPRRGKGLMYPVPPVPPVPPILYMLTRGKIKCFQFIGKYFPSYLETSYFWLYRLIFSGGTGGTVVHGAATR